MLRTTQPSGVIHLFALLHALVVLVCHCYGINDALTLTILTMAMTVMLCLKKGMPIDIIAVMVIVVNVAGFVVGTVGAEVIRHFVDLEVEARLLSTILTTELLGWTLILLAKLLRRINGVEEDLSRFDSKQRWTLVIVGVILALRVGAAMLFASPLYAGANVMTYVWAILSSTPRSHHLCMPCHYLRQATAFIKYEGAQATYLDMLCPVRNRGVGIGCMEF